MGIEREKIYPPRKEVIKDAMNIRKILRPV